MTLEGFQALIAQVTSRIVGKPLAPELMDELNHNFPAGGPWFREVELACHRAIADGWMCTREAGGIRYGRVLKAGPETHGFSVDVVHMRDVAGPRHRHPKGEIDLIMPIDPAARFDGCGAGWLVYPPDTVHPPTVRGGAALVLYLLPEGEIDFKPA